MATNSIDTTATRDAVFAVLADGWAYSNWVVGASFVRAVEGAWPAPGSRIFHCAGAWPIALRDQTQIETCEDGRRLVMTASGWPLGEARVEMVLADLPGGCRITMHEDPTSGPGLLGRNRLGDLVLHRRNTESLQRLAAICERRTAPGVATVPPVGP